MATVLHQATGRLSASANGRSRLLGFEDVEIIERWRPNILITGAPVRTADALDELDACIRTPVARWFPGKALELPADATTPTLILTEPSLMSSDEQHYLLEWMENNPRVVQVITITSVPLFGLIATGAFSHQLYYRLNLVHFDLGA